MSQNQVFVDYAVNYLISLATEHEETSHEYHLQILRIPSRPGLDTLRNVTFMEVLEEIIEDEEQEAKVRSTAFAALLAYLWRWRDYQRFRQVFDSYHDIFVESSPSLVALYQGMYDLSRISNQGGRQQAMKSARDAKEAMPRMPGALNLFAEVIAIANERGDATDADLDQAMEAIQRAIDIDPEYAKYYSNRARILAVKGRYDESYRDVDKAIELETSEYDEYLLRIANYESIRTSIQLLERSVEINRQSDAMREEQERASKQLGSMRGETLTLLGLLAAVIAFVVPSVQLVSNLQSAEAGLLMTFMAGLILVVFGSFMELIQPGERWRRKGVLVVSIGLSMVLLASLILWSGIVPE